MRSKWLACLLVLSACPDVTTSNNTGAAAVIEFDPQNSIVPFPNNLVLDPATGKVNLPAQACETAPQKAVRTGVLNTLDGFGTYETTITATLTAMPDASSTAASVYLYKRAPIASTTPIPVTVQVATTARFDPANCGATPASIPQLVIVPKVPLDPKSTYTLAIVDGLTAGGNPVKASFVWGLVRQSEDPVTLADGCDHTTLTGCTVLSNHTPIPEPTSDSASDPNLVQLVGVDTLWNAHKAALEFLDTTGVVTENRANLLVAADFNTQTTTDPLDPQVAGSPAATLSAVPLLGTFSVPTQAGAPCDPVNGCKAFMTAVGVPCSSLPCAAVGDVFGTGLTTQPYQVLQPNPFSSTMMIPGAWNDPIHPTAQAGVVLQAVAFVPNPAAFGLAGPPPFGWPVVVFGHGLTRHKEDLFGIASQFAAAGYASIAIDMQLHGSRAVPISKDPTLGCAGTCATAGTACDTLTPCGTGDTCKNAATLPVDPINSPQCFAPFLAADPAQGRDTLRQTVLDQLRLIKAVKSCGPGNCTSANNTSVFTINPDEIFYVGQSMGGIVGSMTASSSSDLKAAVVNVTGVGIIDMAENTQNEFFKCAFVNNLIAGGILTGTVWNPFNPTVGLCTTDAWKTDPAWLAARPIVKWVLDPGDPANYVKGHPGYLGLAARHFLQQEVVNDMVVPNIASDAEGMLLNKSPLVADPAASATPAPSAAITNMPTESKWVRYPTLPADAGTGFPGNTFAHGSLLAPANAMLDGALGLIRMQTDAIYYLHDNL